MANALIPHIFFFFFFVGFFVVVFVVLGLELRVSTLSHSTSPFVMDFFPR
jgi:hypothetical protein